MKKLLMVFLALCLAGCGVQKPAPETEAPVTEAVTVPETVTTEPPTTAPTEPTYPETMEAEINLEGEPQKITMELFDGGSYVIYIPKDQWTQETEMQDGYLTDRWSTANGGDVTLEVISFGTMTAEAAEKRLLVLNGSTYHFDEARDMYIGGVDPVLGRYMIFTVRSDGSNTFALVGEYPLEFGDGFAPRLRTMMDSFLIK